MSALDEYIEEGRQEWIKNGLEKYNKQVIINLITDYLN